MAEYISREAAFNAVLNLAPKVDDDGYCWVIRGDAARAIDSIPAADVRTVVRGRWELLQVADEAGDKWNRWFCSECGHVAAVGWEHTRDGAKPKYNFCPNCGAVMEES